MSRIVNCLNATNWHIDFITRNYPRLLKVPTLILLSSKYKTQGVSALTFQLSLFSTNKLQQLIKKFRAKFWNEIPFETKIYSFS